MAILQVGSGLQLRAASTGSKEEDYENDAATIVQKCVGVNSQEDNLIVFVILLILRFSSFNSWKSMRWLDRPSVTLAELEER